MSDDHRVPAYLGDLRTLVSERPTGIMVRRGVETGTGGIQMLTEFERGFGQVYRFGGQGRQDRSPQRRDRLMQVFLAQARGTVRNGDLLRSAIDRMLRMQVGNSVATGTTMMKDALIETLTKTVEALDRESIRYAVTGSIASSVHGEPFMSEDVDLIVQASRRQAEALAALLSPRFYAPADMLGEAAERHSFTNVVDNRTGLKVDLSFIPATGYLSEALARRVEDRIGSAEPRFWFVTPEDIILMKLLWRKDSRSQKQWENALSVVRVRGARLDWKYLFEQARELDLVEDLTALRDEGGV